MKFTIQYNSIQFNTIKRYLMIGCWFKGKSLAENVRKLSSGFITARNIETSDRSVLILNHIETSQTNPHFVGEDRFLSFV